MIKLNSLITYLFLAIGVTSLTRTVFILWNASLPDLIVFYHYSQQLFQGINPYEIEHIFSPPIALLIFSPIIIFPIEIAQKLWLLLSIVLFFISLILLRKIFKLSLTKLIFVFSLSIIAFPFKFTLGMGQTNFLLLFFILSFIYFFTIKRETVSIIFLSLGIALKLSPLILVFELIFLKKWKMMVALLGTLILLSLVPIFLTGKFVNFYHIQNIIFPLVVNPPTITVYYDQSITGFLARTGIPELASSIIRYAILSLTILVAYKNKEKSIYVFILLLTGFLLINKFTWQHQLILLIPAFSYFLSKKLTIAKGALLTLAYLLIMVNIKNPSIVGSSLLGNIILTHGFFGLLIIWILLMLDSVKDYKTIKKSFR